MFKEIMTRIKTGKAEAGLMFNIDYYLLSFNVKTNNTFSVTPVTHNIWLYYGDKVLWEIKAYDSKMF